MLKVHLHLSFVVTNIYCLAIKYSKRRIWIPKMRFSENGKSDILSFTLPVFSVLSRVTSLIYVYKIIKLHKTSNILKYFSSSLEYCRQLTLS